MGKKWITKNGYIIQQVLDSNNPLLVSNKTTSILIDTGSRKKWMKLSDKINCILSNKLKLSAVILTHTHHDHVQNARSFKDTFKLDIIVHKSEAEYLKDGGSIYITSNNEKYIKNYEPVMWDIQTDDKYDLCNYDLDAYILHTPGHSTGSVSIIIDNEIAIVGDALSGLDNKPFKRTLKKVSEDIKSSWDKLLNLKCLLYLPAHRSHRYQALEYKDFNELYRSYLTSIKS